MDSETTEVEEDNEHTGNEPEPDNNQEETTKEPNLDDFQWRRTNMLEHYQDNNVTTTTLS